MKWQKSQGGSASTRDFFQKRRSSRKTKPSPYICETLRPEEFSPTESKTQMWVATQMFLSSFAGMGKLLLQGSGNPCCGLAPPPPANNTWQIRRVFLLLLFLIFFFMGKLSAEGKSMPKAALKAPAQEKQRKGWYTQAEPLAPLGRLRSGTSRGPAPRSPGSAQRRPRPRSFGVPGSCSTGRLSV